MSNAQKVTLNEFEAKVLKSDKPIIVDFYADWCGPCKALAPVLDEVAGEYEGKATIVKVNVDEESTLAQQYGIRGMPTMLFFKDGQVQETLVGNQPKHQITKSLSNLI